MKFLLPIFLLLPCSLFGQGFSYSHTDSIQVTSTAKINGIWDTLKSIGHINTSGIANCRTGQLIDNRSDVIFDTTIVRAGKKPMDFSFAGFSVEANAGAGWKIPAFLQLEEKISFHSFTKFSIWASQIAGYFDKFDYGFMGGISLELLNIGNE